MDAIYREATTTTKCRVWGRRLTSRSMIRYRLLLTRSEHCSSVGGATLQFPQRSDDCNTDSCAKASIHGEPFRMLLLDRGGRRTGLNVTLSSVNSNMSKNVLCDFGGGGGVVGVQSEESPTQLPRTSTSMMSWLTCFPEGLHQKFTTL